MICPLKKHCFTGLFFCLVALLPLGCQKGPHQPSPISYGIEYTVDIPRMGLSSIRVTVNILEAGSADEQTLILPPVYADNPMLKPRGFPVESLSVTDQTGMLAFSYDSIEIDGAFARTISFSAASFPIQLKYSAKLDYQDSLHAFMPRPHVSSREGYLQGAYHFAVPYEGGSLVEFWRRQRSIKVNYARGKNVVLMGDPPQVDFNNAYELLFSTNALLAASHGDERVLTGSSEYSFVSVGDASHKLNPLLEERVGAFQSLLGSAFDRFGKLPVPVVVILGAMSGGGLEGMSAFSILDPWEDDTLGIYNTVLAHEILHFWVGVRTGEYDLPWWKEGTTTYLGLQLTAQRELCDIRYVRDILLRDLSNQEDVQQFSLNDPNIRARIFDPERDFGDLVYVKGAQLSMILDEAIRKNTSNTETLLGITAGLTAEYDGGAFGRSDFTRAIRKAGGTDAENILKQYADTPGAIHSDTLVAVFQRLRNRGAFGASAMAKRSSNEKGDMPLKLRKY